MSGKLFVTALSCIALGIASPALAQPGGGGGGGGGAGGGGGGGGGAGMGGGGAGGGGGGMGGGSGGGGGFGGLGGIGGGGSGGGFGGIGGGGGSGGGFGVGGSGSGGGGSDANVAAGRDVREIARQRSQAAERAALIAIEKANPNSVLATAVNGGPLNGLEVGMTVLGPNSETLGTVQRIVARPDGTIVVVLVKSADGERMIPLAPNGLTIQGGTLVASSFPGTTG